MRDEKNELPTYFWMLMWAEFGACQTATGGKTEEKLGGGTREEGCDFGYEGWRGWKVGWLALK